jgi:hypothetical protein
MIHDGFRHDAAGRVACAEEEHVIAWTSHEATFLRLGAAVAACEIAPDVISQTLPSQQFSVRKLNNWFIVV